MIFLELSLFGPIAALSKYFHRARRNPFAGLIFRLAVPMSLSKVTELLLYARERNIKHKFTFKNFILRKNIT